MIVDYGYDYTLWSILLGDGLVSCSIDCIRGEQSWSIYEGITELYKDRSFLLFDFVGMGEDEPLKVWSVE